MNLGGSCLSSVYSLTRSNATGIGAWIKAAKLSDSGRGTTRHCNSGRGSLGWSFWHWRRGVGVDGKLQGESISGAKWKTKRIYTNMRPGISMLKSKTFGFFVSQNGWSGPPLRSGHRIWDERKYLCLYDDNAGAIQARAKECWIWMIGSKSWTLNVDNEEMGVSGRWWGINVETPSDGQTVKTGGKN